MVKNPGSSRSRHPGASPSPANHVRPPPTILVPERRPEPMIASHSSPRAHGVVNPRRPRRHDPTRRTRRGTPRGRPGRSSDAFARARHRRAGWLSPSALAADRHVATFFQSVRVGGDLPPELRVCPAVRAGSRLAFIVAAAIFLLDPARRARAAAGRGWRSSPPLPPRAWVLDVRWVDRGLDSTSRTCFSGRRASTPTRRAIRR
jgi:hypothetical protein